MNTEYLTAEQRLDLAKDIIQLIFNKYPSEKYEGQNEALAIAHSALTNAFYKTTLVRIN